MISYITSWLKRHHWMHDWSKWEEKEYALTYFSFSSVPAKLAGTKIYQDRQCSVCGKKESVSL